MHLPVARAAVVTAQKRVSHSDVSSHTPIVAANTRKSSLNHISTRLQSYNTVSPLIALPSPVRLVTMPHAKRLASHAQPIVTGRCLHMHYSSSDVQAFRLCCQPASHRSSRHRLCNSLQQLRTRPTRPPFFRGHPVSGAFPRRITTDFRTLAREPPLCANACVTWLQGLPCTLVPRTFLFPFVVTTNSRTCPIRRARKSSPLVSLIATLLPWCTSTPPKRPALQKRSCDMCALCGFPSFE